MAGFKERLAQHLDIAVAESTPILRGQRHPGARGRFGKDARVGAAAHRDSVQGARDPEDVFERPPHRAGARTAGEDKRAVDVEENDRDGAGRCQRRPITIPSERSRRAAPWETTLRRTPRVAPRQADRS